VQGTLEGKPVRRSLDLTNWEAAVLRIREMEIYGAANTVTIGDACDRFMDDVKANGVGPAQTSKYQLLVRDLKEEFGIQSLRSITTDDLRAFREKWDLSLISKAKKLERLRTMFKFFHSNGWIAQNPATPLAVRLTNQTPTLPFSDEQWKSIIEALDRYGEVHAQSPPKIRKELRALLLLLRHSGLRMSDAVALKRDYVSGSRIFLYQAKTGHPVYLPLPLVVIEALKGIEGKGIFYFRTGSAKLKSDLKMWGERLKKVFVLAGIPDGHPHRLRDTFAVQLLNAGTPIEMVATILGHTSTRVTERHYSPWVKSRNDALESAVKATW
jgi:integrase